MIQRIQTVWLFLASGTLLLLFLFPYLQFFDNYGVGMAIKITGIYQGVSEGVIQVESNILQTIATVIASLLPLVTISFFRDRKKQIKLALITIFIVFLLGLWFFFTARNAVQLVNKSIAIENIGIGSLLIPLAIVFLVLAIKGIRKDENLIRSVDRLRG